MAVSVKIKTYNLQVDILAKFVILCHLNAKIIFNSKTAHHEFPMGNFQWLVSEIQYFLLVDLVRNKNRFS